MYKYHPITGNISEILVAVGSLPICTIVFDSKADLVGMNQLASNFLQIKNREDYLNGTFKIETDYQRLKVVISKLKRERITFNKTIRIKRVDGNHVDVRFNACMISGKQCFFLFQFSEKASAANEFDVYTNSLKRRKQSVQFSPQKPNQDLLSCNSEQGFDNYHSQQIIIARLLEKHSDLTNCEIELCKLIVKNKTIVEIAELSQKTRNNIYGSVRQIIRKLGLKSTKELNRYLNGLSV